METSSAVHVKIEHGKKKRTVNKSEWTKEKRKRLRIAGASYVNSKGEVVGQREPGPDCQCRRRCYERISKATRLRLFQGYYELKSHDEQNAYLFGLIRKVPIARKRSEGSTRRTCTFNYFIRVGGQEQQVCVKALANIHGVGKSKIHILCEKLGQNVLFPRDERGRHSKMPKKVTDETMELAKAHIISILHSERLKDFLKDEKANNGPEVNITQMHKNFLETHDPEYFLELANWERALNPGSWKSTTFEAEKPSEINVPQTCWEIRYEGNSPNATVQLVVADDGVPQQVAPPPNPVFPQKKNKRKTTKEGRPEPIIRQWLYSKIFHDFYTNKEAIALRKKVISWRLDCSDDMFVSKTSAKKKRTKTTPIKTENPDVVEVEVQPQIIQQQAMPQVQIIQARVNKGNGTFSIPITTTPQMQKIQLQSIPVSSNKKNKPMQVFNAQTSDNGMYNIYPMILQDLTGLDGHTVPIQHFQGQPMAITTTNLQALVNGVNINITQPGQQQTVTTVPTTLMSYKFE